jgi:hypothetical protein
MISKVSDKNDDKKSYSMGSTFPHTKDFACPHAKTKLQNLFLIPPKFLKLGSDCLLLFL